MSVGVWKIHAGGVACVACIGAATYGFGVRPVLERQSRHSELQVEIAADRDRVAEAQEKERALHAEMDTLRSLGAGWAELRGEPRTLNEQLAELAAFAERHNLVLTTTRPGEPEARAFFTVRRISLAGTGGYAPCAAFLHDFVEAFPDATVEGFEVKAQGTENARGATFRFDLAWYADSAGVEANSPGESG